MSVAAAVHLPASGFQVKLGLRKPTNAPAIMLADILTGAVPAHPAVADHLGSRVFGLYANDRFGVCGPTSVANLARLVSYGLTGVERIPTQADVFKLYRESGNPNFDPNTGADDNGVDMQTMLNALLKGGIGGLKPVAFAKVDAGDDNQLAAAVSIFGGVLWGVDLQTAQQAQTDAVPPTWDYSQSGEWGGHAILNGAYATAGTLDVISWAKRVRTTAKFRRAQLSEAWVVVWPWNLEHPAFQAGVDVNALADAYKALTGKVLPVPVTPPPPPPPVTPPIDPPPVTPPAGPGKFAGSGTGNVTVNIGNQSVTIPATFSGLTLTLATAKSDGADSPPADFQ